jgi:hypothetical protein
MRGSNSLDDATRVVCPPGTSGEIASGGLSVESVLGIHSRRAKWTWLVGGGIPELNWLTHAYEA